MTIREFYEKPRQGLVKKSGRRHPFSILVLMLFVITLTAFEAAAQERTVTGKVVSTKDNSPIPGVNILIKGTNKGTVTDMNGQFTVSATDADILVISQIGMESQEITVGNRTSIDVNLAESTSVLEEVVVTALGISQEKRTLGYSVQEVKGADIAATQRPNFLTSLQGRVAGLTMTPTSGAPGSSVSVTLRGVSSIGGSNQPLIVVDGLVINNSTFNQHSLVSDLDNRNNDYTNRAADINPNDIETVTVLKGPEASALYGQDGASGVIVITTKKGNKGGGRIFYDNSFGFQKTYLFPEVQKMYGRGTNGNTDPAALLYFGPRYPDNTKFYDNKDKFFETGFSQQHNLSFEGGNEQTTFLLSANYLNQKGTIPTSSYEKLSLKLSGTSKINEKLEATTSFNYIYSDNMKPVRGQYGFLINTLSWPSNDDMTNYLNVDGTRRFTTTSTNAELDNPFFSINKNNNEDIVNRMLGNISLSYKPLSWVSIVGRLGADVSSTQGNTFLHPESYNGPNTSAPLSGGKVSNGSIENYTNNARLMNGTLIGTANKAFGKFKTTLLFGGAFDDNRSEVNVIRGEQLLIKDYNSINNASQASMRDKATLTQKRVVSLLGSFTLNYNDLAYLTVNGRNDWSSSLPLENNSYFYPSVSLSFVFTELEALSNLGPLTYGKLRASAAQSGKDAPPYRTGSALTTSTYFNGGFAYGFFGGNPALKPEKTEGFEVGTELKFYENRIGLDVAVYKNDRLNQIVPGQRLSYATGFVLKTLNGGNFSNRGIEIQLTGIPVKTNDFQWDVILNFSKSKTLVTSLPAPTVVYEYYNSDTWVYGNARGSAFSGNLQPFFPTANLDYNQDGAGTATAIGGASYLRNDNGDILVNPANGLPVVNNNFLPIGDRNPDFNIGLTNSFRYKNFNLSFLLDIRKGGDIFNANELFLYRNGLSTRSLNRETPVIIQGVLRDGNENTATPTANTIQVSPYIMGSTYFNSIPESEFVEHDINWLRLRDITLSYMIPSTILNSQTLLKSASVFMTATDVFLITNYSGADPGVNGTTPGTTGAGAAGIDFSSLSSPRTVSFGLRIGL